MRNQFTAVFERDAGRYIGYCPKDPGANGQGKTLDECRDSLRDALLPHLCHSLAYPIALGENRIMRRRRCHWKTVSRVVLPTWAAALVLSAAVGSAPPTINEPPITEADRQHWAFRPLRRIAPPAVQNRTWPRNSIDRFILARLEKAGLTPMPPADRVTLIRRVSFDLTGLLPTPEQVDAFAGDQSPDAYDKLIDRLLASAAYGQRWAQHWLDLARFAETDGFEHDKPRPDAWKYRDWVIDALNRDIPYDEFIGMQIAGDELNPGDERAALATGFTLCGPDMPDINLQEERRHIVLNDITSTVGSVFLGLQIGCAQCHDHKYDPISQSDFYRLRAFFENVELFKEHKVGRVLHESSGKPKTSHLMIRGDFRRPGPEVKPAFPRIANPWGEQVAPPRLGARTSGRRTALALWLSRPGHSLTTRVIVNRLWQHHFGYGLVRTPSDFGLMGEEPTHVGLLDWLATELPRQGWSLKRMHKLMLSSATYRQASRPTVPSWAPKQAAAAAISWKRTRRMDRENRLLARMNRQRLDGEAIRDAMLAASNQLSPRPGGPGVMPPLPEELLTTLLKGQWEVTPNEQEHRRRSIYLFVRRNLRFPMFETFDRPDTNASCPRRSRSTTAPQALVLLNSQESLSAARHLAGFVLDRVGADRNAQIELCYRRALSRRPTGVELTTAQQFLAEQTTKLAQEGRQPADLPSPIPCPSGLDPYAGAALSDLCLALFNLNEFIYID